MKLLLVTLLAAALVFPGGCKLQAKSASIALPNQTAGFAAQMPAKPTPETNAKSTIKPQQRSEVYVAFAQGIIRRMTVEQKIGQLIVMRYSEEDEIDLIGEVQPGGIIFGIGDCITPDQTRRIVKEMNDVSKIPLIITCTEEGGKVTRVTGKDMPTTLIPSLEVIGKTGEASSAFLGGSVLGAELYSLGINLNLAPVADVYSNPDNKVIAGRSFGDNPRMVAEFVKQMVEGMRAEGVGTTLKHFPGHGNTVEDSHKTLAYNNSTLEQLYNSELIPFIAGIEAGSDAVMIAHVILPNVQENEKPATISHEVTTGLLRGELGFEGLIISDNMDMSGMTDYLPVSEASVAAVNAGIDLLLIPEWYAKDVYQTLLAAVRDGKISPERLDEAVRRILLFKLEHHLFDQNLVLPDPEVVLGSDEHVQIVREIVKKSK
jgi:beta-N-acetylhexosaminidase